MQAPLPPIGPGAPAPPFEGTTPAGEAAGLDPAVGEWEFLFLTSGCRECAAAWDAARSSQRSERGRPLLVVTPGPETESRRKVADLARAPRGRDGGGRESLHVLMSTAAWHAYRVTKAPWSVHVRDGAVITSRPAG